MKKWFSIVTKKSVEIKESEGWELKYPTGPVHWDIREKTSGKILATEIPANQLRNTLEKI